MAVCAQAALSSSCLSTNGGYVRLTGRYWLVHREGPSAERPSFESRATHLAAAPRAL